MAAALPKLGLAAWHGSIRDATHGKARGLAADQCEEVHYQR